jgi:hypothetical protein
VRKDSSASCGIATVSSTEPHATYNVTEIEEAVAAAASGGRSGKILIVPRG